MRGVDTRGWLRTAGPCVAAMVAALGCGTSEPHRPRDAGGDAAADAGPDGALDAGPCVDLDGDGAGVSGACARDCDDTDPALTDACGRPDVCAEGIHVTGCPCAGDAPVACYTGPPSTAGQGECAPGQRACADGALGPCLGQVLPVDEQCDERDEDCDGEVDEGVCEEWRCGPPQCDSTCGVLGGSCRNDRNCELQQGEERLLLSCVSDAASGFEDGMCLGLPSEEAPHFCDPADPLTCPDDQAGTCRVDVLGDRSHCLRACTRTLDFNCGCRQGYACDLTAGVCMPGCRVETEAEDCCRRWQDLDGDGAAGPEEWVAIEGCTARCDPDTFRCANDGAAGGAIGAACASDLDCSPTELCFPERGAGDAADARPRWPGGTCAREACDLPGRACPADTSCVTLDATLGPASLCLAACTVADTRIADPHGDPNPACREGYGCVALPELAGRPACADDDACADGTPCLGGVCGGDGVCFPLAGGGGTRIRFCDLDVYPGSACPPDDPATAGWDETERCVDGVCQAPCDDAHPCDANGDGRVDSACVSGACAWSNVGGPCRDAAGPIDPLAPDAACVSPFGQGRCLAGGPWPEQGACVLESCDASGTQDACGDGRRCVSPEGPAFAPRRAPWGRFWNEELGARSALCVDDCALPPDDCGAVDACQGPAVGCPSGAACVALTDGDASGVCLASCSERPDPDAFCADAWGTATPRCDLVTGVCEVM